MEEFNIQPETKCGFYIDEKRKKLWKVELDLLNKLVEVCNKYNLKYYAIGGTLLGAVRHKGFIPWDDDIDIVMFRDDYNKLLEVGETEFKYPYFLSSPLTEKDFWRTHAQLRNSETTGCTKADLKKNNNKGIFIDIFVLDELPDDEKLKKKYVKTAENMAKIMSRSLYWKNGFEVNNKFKVLIQKIYLKILKAFVIRKNTTKDWFEKYNEHCAKYNHKGNKKITYLSLGYREKVVWDKSNFDEAEDVDFENIKITIPKKYDEILTIRYGGDYMKIPESHPEPTHGGIIYDPDTPYQKYIEKVEVE